MEERATETAGTDQATAADPSALARELATARERLAFYEGFDRLIQENIARSGDLMREAITQREASAREAARARAELDRRLDEQRATLAGLGEELVALQERTGALARRVIAALDDLTDVPVFPTPIVLPADPASSPSPPAATAGTDTVGGMAGAGDTESAPLVAGADAAAVMADTQPPTASAGVDAAPAVPPVFYPPQAPTAPPASDELAPSAPPAPTPEPVATEGAASVASEQPRSVAVVVHGVPRAAAALSLQRHLAGLPSVSAVEAREYAGGVLRLQVETRAPLVVDDLRDWEEGAGLEPVHVLPGVIEVKLPGAAGL